MKKILIAAVAALAVTSCSNDLSDLNVNGKAPENVPAGALFANATMSYFDFTAAQDVNFNNLRLWSQFWTQVTYIEESNFELDERDVNGSTFRSMYSTVIRDCEDARKALETTPATAGEKLAAEGAIEVMEVLAYSFLVDLFGDVPYSEALSSETNVPVYDDDAVIYADLLNRLDAAVGQLSGTSAFGSSDIIYGGDAAAWKKAAYSLMLRMAVRIIDVDPTAAQAWGEKAIAGGVFMSSADDMRLFYSSAPPHTHPMWESLVQSGRTDFVASATLGNVLNQLDDPRSGAFFKNLGSGDSVIASLHGDNISDYSAFSNPGIMLEDPTQSHAAINYVEVEFLMAHAAVAGWSGAGDAATHYNAGITASMEEWLGAGVDASAYLAQPAVAFSAATAGLQIGVQKWIAMYSNTSEAYAAVRQYDLPMSVAVVAETATPNRYSYPLDEISLNTDNRQAAADKFNNDDTFAKIFWDM
jgi:hypothetical protein